MLGPQLTERESQCQLPAAREDSSDVPLLIGAIIHLGKALRVLETSKVLLGRTPPSSCCGRHGRPGDRVVLEPDLLA